MVNGAGTAFGQPHLDIEFDRTQVIGVTLSADAGSQAMTVRDPKAGQIVVIDTKPRP
jgi:hypothetical protein